MGLLNRPVDMAFLPKIVMAVFAAAALIAPREARASPMKKASMSANKRELQEVIRRGYDERWTRAITHVKVESAKKEMDNRSTMHLSKQYATGIGCECRCRVAPPRMFKKEAAAAAAAAAASRGGGGSADAMKPRIVKRSVAAKREKMTRAEKKKVMKKLMKEAEKRKEKKEHEREELKKKEETLHRLKAELKQKFQ